MRIYNVSANSVQCFKLCELCSGTQQAKKHLYVTEILMKTSADPNCTKGAGQQRHQSAEAFAFISDSEAYGQRINQRCARIILSPDGVHTSFGTAVKMPLPLP